MATFRKDPDARLDYTVDWSRWLPDGDAVATATWTVADGIEQTDTSLVDGKATMWLAGGTVGQSYEAVCRVVTMQGRTDERTINIVVSDR